MYGDYYIQTIRRQAAEQKAKSEADAAAKIQDPRAALRAKLSQWQSTISPEAAVAGFCLEDIRKAVPATLQNLGVALWELGWSRKRVWSNTGPFRRYWFPPSAE